LPSAHLKKGAVSPETIPRSHAYRELARRICHA
jgi:hypothetical protein